MQNKELTMQNGTVPWSTEHKGHRLTTEFDLSRVDLKKTNLIEPIIDAVTQIIENDDILRYYVPHDHFDDDGVAEVTDAELKLAREHLNNTKIVIVLKSFSEEEKKKKKKKKKASDSLKDSLAYSRGYEDGVKITLNADLFERNLTGHEFKRAVVLGVQTLIHELGHAKPRGQQYDVETPEKAKKKKTASFYSKTAQTVESGFCLTDAVFGGEILPSGQKGAATFEEFTKEGLFKKNLCFRSVSGDSTNVQVDDGWVSLFVERTATILWSTFLDSADEIPLLPSLIAPSSFKVPTVEQVRASCYTHSVKGKKKKLKTNKEKLKTNIEKLKPNKEKSKTNKE
jgi:hypothetical protein